MLTRALHLLPPETAHRLAIAALGHGLVPRHDRAAWPRLSTTLCGYELPNPLGLAAGFDKNGEALTGLAKLGFGFIEVGTVTPKPQSGNPQPRLFRLRENRALINRLGFNNLGLAAMQARLAARRPGWGVIGVNLGANRDASDPVADYVAGLRGVYDLADYVTVNVSSPNTPGLRQLQSRARLDALLQALLEVREELAGGRAAKPLLLKIAPDLAPEDEDDIAAVVLERGIDGLIVCNTTIDRPATLAGHHRDQAGGLSGPPLFARSTEQLRRFHQLTGGRLPLVGVGGIASGADAYAKLRAGASALQLYTGFIYGGPGGIVRILRELERLLARDGYAHLRDAVGVEV